MPTIKRSNIEKKYADIPVTEMAPVSTVPTVLTVQTINTPIPEVPSGFTQLVAEFPKPASVIEPTEEVSFKEEEEEHEKEEILKPKPATKPELKLQPVPKVQLQRIVLFKESKLTRIIK